MYHLLTFAHILFDRGTTKKKVFHEKIFFKTEV